METEILKKGLEVADKTMELANKVYDDGLSKPTKAIGNGLTTCLNFLGAIVSPIIYEYIQNAEYKKKEIDKKLSNKYSSIPEDKRVEPRMNIMGPAVELLKYNLDENHIKDIFINIMCNEMNSEKQQKVLPSYIEIVRQLSKNDAQTLKSFYQLYKSKGSSQFILDIIRAKPNAEKHGYIELDKYVIGNASKKNNITSLHTIRLDPIVIDNLCRLELIKIYDEKYIPDIEDYEIGFNSIKNQYNNLKNYLIYYEKGIVQLTEYGINFLNICFE